MLRIVLPLFFFLISAFSFSQDTFSIVAVDPATGEVGSAGASCIGAGLGIPEGCIIISDVHPGVGAIHTQAYYLAGNQNYAEDLMDQGYSPQQIIDSVVANDVQNNPLIRQYGVVDFTGAVGYTGANCDDYKNHITGATYAIQGNILLGQYILDSMEARFLNTPGSLACRLMAALQGANVPGADTRCLDEGISSLSAFIRVAQPDDTSGTLTLDLNVKSVPDDWSVDPIDSLQTLFDAANGCFPIGISEELTEFARIYPNPAHEYVVISAQKNLREILLHDSIARIIWNSGTQAGQKSVRLKISDWPAGFKILEAVFEDGSTEMFELIIQ